jgi:hypothetical protein
MECGEKERYIGTTLKRVALHDVVEPVSRFFQGSLLPPVSLAAIHVPPFQGFKARLMHNILTINVFISKFTLDGKINNYSSGTSVIIEIPNLNKVKESYIEDSLQVSISS